jgi:hypothetical protein
MTTDSGGNDDRLVGETYREAATERAPDHLNTAVMRNAAKAARPRYFLLRTWTRPVAWAAVVMLSVGLVLELTQAPVIHPVDESVMAEPAMNDSELRVSDTDMLEQAKEMARMQQGPNGEADLPAAAAIPFSEKSALRSSATLVDAESGCDETARGEPQLWLECITELETAGHTDLASMEREQLAEAFPDFDQE